MIQRFPLLMLAAIVSFTATAQDTQRMAEVAKTHAADGKFMGAVLVAKAGQPIFEETYGHANLEWKTEFTPDTKFRIGSVTKQFTAAAVLLLAEQGMIDLDDPVAKHLPDTPPAWKNVTIHQLLTHTSGIPSVTSQPGYATWKLSPSTPAQSLAHVRDLPLEFAPGEKFTYSNSGYILLGQLIEELTGRSYAEFVTEQIFRPLDMNDSGYDSNTALLEHRAAGYVSTPNGPANAPLIDMHLPHAAGGLYSTTHDLVRWTEGLFGGKLLAPASLEKMVTPAQSNYGYGVIVRTINGRKVIEHGGGIEGFNAHLAYYPEAQVTVAVLANINGPTASQLASQLGAIALGQSVTLTAERQPIDVPESTLRQYVGVYQLLPQLTNTVRWANGHLTTQLTGQSAFRLYPESETKFFLMEVDAQVEFARDTAGRVTHLILHQGGNSREAPRISDTVVERAAIALSRAIKRDYVGTYELRPGFDLVITLEGDQLMSQATGQRNLPVYPESETKFFLRVVDAQIEFIRDEAGAVTHLVLHQGGRTMKAPRK